MITGTVRNTTLKKYNVARSLMSKGTTKTKALKTAGISYPTFARISEHTTSVRERQQRTAPVAQKTAKEILVEVIASNLTEATKLTVISTMFGTPK